MNKAEFDRVADEYTLLHSQNIKASGEDPDFFAKYKIKDVAAEVAKSGITVNRILDFGCGIGNSLPYFNQFFPKAVTTCADVSLRSLELSQARNADIQAEYVEINGDSLPIEDESFELCFSACVFHHISEAEHIHWLLDLRRVTKKNGMLVIFEHNPLNPLTVSAVRDCPFDENAVLIRAAELKRRILKAGWKNCEVVYRIFFPRSFAFARPMEKYLRKVPLGAQYFVCARNT